MRATIQVRRALPERWPARYAPARLLTRAPFTRSSCSSSSRCTMRGAAAASYVPSPSTSTYTSASTSANMRRTTLPLPRSGSVRTTAPASAAFSTVWSVEPLS